MKDNFLSFLIIFLQTIITNKEKDKLKIKTNIKQIFLIILFLKMVFKLIFEIFFYKTIKQKHNKAYPKFCFCIFFLELHFSKIVVF